MNDSPTNTGDFAPWLHPKAQRWLLSLFDKSDLINEVEAWVFRDSEELNADQLRMATVLLVILGHPKIWPVEQRDRLQKLAARLHTLSKQIRSERTSAVSIAEHKKMATINEEWEYETELLRRRAAISKRTTKVQTPKTWLRFWN